MMINFFELFENGKMKKYFCRWNIFENFEVFNASDWPVVAFFREVLDCGRQVAKIGFRYDCLDQNWCKVHSVSLLNTKNNPELLEFRVDWSIWYFYYFDNGTNNHAINHMAQEAKLVEE